MLNTKTSFENVGMGVSIAGGWIQVEGRRQAWVSLMATSEGAGRRRDWFVSASYHDKGGDPIRVTTQKTACFRYEAADLALAELFPFIAKAAA